MRKLVLIASGAVFYASFDARLVAILAAVVVANGTMVHAISKGRGVVRTTALVMGIFLKVAALAICK